MDVVTDLSSQSISYITVFQGICKERIADQNTQSNTFAFFLTHNTWLRGRFGSRVMLRHQGRSYILKPRLPEMNLWTYGNILLIILPSRSSPPLTSFLTNRSLKVTGNWVIHLLLN